MIRFFDDKRQVKLSVHDVMAAGPPHGDLYLQVAWTAQTRMRIGTEIHVQYQETAEKENPQFQKEVAIKHVVVLQGWEVEIAGRIDGVIIEKGEHRIEEIKTSTLPGHLLKEKTLEDMPHWRSQVELYLHFLDAQGVRSTGELVVISVVDGTEHRLPVPINPTQGQYIESQLLWLIGEREKQILWYNTRWDAAQVGLPFAHETWRDGQESMSQQLQDALGHERIVLVRAPTGYGKTAASLYAALQTAYRTHRKVFFATARNTQQQMVEDTVEQLVARGVPIRALSLRAKERACLNDVVSCRPDRCPYAAQYYDKVQEHSLLDTIWDRGMVKADHLEDTGRSFTLCPYELSRNLVQSADVVIGDYNYLFDPSVQLGVIAQNPEQWIVIVDEAHNLPTRAQGYGSPKVSLKKLWAGIECVQYDPRFADFAEPLNLMMDWMLIELNALDPQSYYERADVIQENEKLTELNDIVQQIQRMGLDYAVKRLERPLPGDVEGDPWFEAAWSILAVHTALQRAGEETMLLWQRRGNDRNQSLSISLLGVDSPAEHPETGMELLCRDPSVLLGAFFEKIGSAVCMSATLEPFDFYANLMGIEEERLLTLQFDSLFPADNRAAFVLPFVSTLYRDRHRENPRLARLLEKIIASIPGNMVVFFSSFRVLEDVVNQMNIEDREVLKQGRRMTDRGRTRLLNKMRKGEGHVLFAVMGGIFSEGIDLPGDALQAAIMVGPSLPQASLSRRLMQAWYEEKYGDGFRYAWVIPGMARVSQAAGRVIRTETDRGVVILLGNRFAQGLYADLFPKEWTLKQTRHLGDELHRFFGYMNVDNPISL